MLIKDVNESKREHLKDI